MLSVEIEVNDLHLTESTEREREILLNLLIWCNLSTLTHARMTFASLDFANIRSVTTFLL